MKAHIQRRLIVAVLGFALLLGFPACSVSKLRSKTIARLNHSSAARKPFSLADWRAQNDPRLHTLHRAAANTTLLVSGRSLIILTKSYPAIFGSYASAAPITEDGYFLTAAHCVGNSPLTLATITEDRHLVEAPARIVWKGSTNEPDLALLHAAIKPTEHFVLADLSKLRSGDLVALSGWSSWPTGSVAAGRVLRVSPLRREPSGFSWRSVRHDAPLASGDSGGPLITVDGRLAGINVQMRYGSITSLRAWMGVKESPRGRLSDQSGDSFLPDPNWLCQVIAADRRAFGSRYSRK